MIRTANVGEWSELYALAVILSNGGLYASDDNEQKRDDLFYAVREVYISSTTAEKSRKYVISPESIEVLDGNNQQLAVCSRAEIAKLAEQLFAVLSVHQDGRAFSLPAADELIDQLHIVKLKATSIEKSDLSLVLVNETTNTPTLPSGFSIKSQIGAPSTLINASVATNFTYKIRGNGMPKGFIPKQVKKNTQALYAQGLKLEFQSVDSPTYAKNMRLIDPKLPEYLAELLVGFYRRRGGSVADVMEEVFTEDKEHKIVKIKEFFFASALGLMPSKDWNGQITTVGGIVLVKRTGDVLCFYLDNPVDFQDFLVKHTKFDTPSTTRYKIGEIIPAGQDMSYKLNLQIRFKV